MIYIPVVILSYAKTPEFHEMTQNCIDSLHASESDINFLPIVVETNPEEQHYSMVFYEIHPHKPFNYSAFQNIGIEYAKSERSSVLCFDKICLANNDLIFKKGWASHIIGAMNQLNLDSASPFSPTWNAHIKYFTDGMGTGRVYYGLRVCLEFTGWCLMFKWESLLRLLPLDERFDFWFADNDMSLRMYKMGMKHALVRDAEVVHLCEQSHKLLVNPHKSTHGAEKKFIKKYKGKIHG